MTTQTESYKHVFDDFERGKKLEDCPYAKRTIEMMEYYKGWRYAKNFFGSY